MLGAQQVTLPQLDGVNEEVIHVNFGPLMHPPKHCTHTYHSQETKNMMKESCQPCGSQEVEK